MTITRQYGSAGNELVVVVKKVLNTTFRTAFSISKYGRYEANKRAKEAHDFIDKHSYRGATDEQLKQAKENFRGFCLALHKVD